MTYPSFRACERIVLVSLLEFFHENDDGEFLTVEEIKEVCKLTLSKIMIFKVLDSLLEKKYLEGVDRPIAEGSEDIEKIYTLTSRGIGAAERAMTSVDEMSQAIATIPASDRVVDLTDNQSEQAIEAVDSALEVIRTSNTIDEEKKSWLRRHLQSGQMLLKSKAILTSAIKSLLIQPIYTAWKVVGEQTAKDALLKVLAVIKHLIGWH